MNMNIQDKIKEIASSIDFHVKQEKEQSIRNKAIARVRCNQDNHGEEVCWIVKNPDNHSSFSIGADTPLKTDGRAVPRDSKLGQILSQNYEGIHPYTIPRCYNPKKLMPHSIEIFNKTTYSLWQNDVIDIEMCFAGEGRFFRYDRLSDILNIVSKQKDVIDKKQEELKRIKEEQERLAKELAEQKEREEQKRLEEERQKLEEENNRRLAEIAELEQKQQEAIKEALMVQSFMRRNAQLRSQHILDPYQEDAKRSHLFDGVPVLIDGGPGTGKTTTMIQRLKFLLSKIALEEYEAPLSKAQISYLTDSDVINSRWLFFSPTDLLLRYLQENMREEGLTANTLNTRTIPKFRNKIMRDYQLFNPAKDGPFKDYKVSADEFVLINNPEKVIKDFEQFIIHSCVLTFTRRAKIKTDIFDWAVDAERIKTQCKRAISGIKDIDALMRIFNSLQDNETGTVTRRRKELNDLVNFEASRLKTLIMKDNSKVEELGMMFERWRKERLSAEEIDDEAIVDDEEETEEPIFNKYDVELQLYAQLKQLLKQLGLRKLDSKLKLSKRNQELFSCVESFIDEDIKIQEIGQLAWFMRNFASLCRGIESNILGIIPKLYKDFRKTQLEGTDYNAGLLRKIIEKDNNKHLHPDEQNLLIGFINEMLNSIYRKSRIRFDKMKHKYAVAYKESVRPVIGIDEATDYSELEYYFMISFRHYDFHSITLCGDILQGLNGNGVKNWEDLNKFFPKPLVVNTLETSYRQLPTLLDMAREIYKDDQGEYPSYHSDKERSDKEPKPLLFISDDEEEKARWISERILEILRFCKELPSIAIFVGENVNIQEFIDRITDLDLLNGIDVVDCSGDKQLQNKEQVRVFRLSEVKGMEFEAAFFYDIDEAIGNKDEELMRRYLYVGISRATSHLAATMKDCSGYEDIVNYFDTETDEW